MRPDSPFAFDEDALLLKNSAQAFLGDRVRAGMVRDLIKQVARNPESVTGSAAIWSELTSLGWTALGVPEECGGVDVSLPAIAGLVEELGRAAAPVPLVSTLSASLLLRACTGEAALACLREIAAGAVATLAFSDAQGSPDPCTSEVVLRGGRLEGSAWYVQNASEADRFVVAARAKPDAMGWYVVNRKAPGVRVLADDISDLTRTQGRVVFEGTEVSDNDQAASQQNGTPAFKHALPALLTIVAADICGSAEWLLQTTADYAKTRIQFGRKIGAFQAVKHPLVDLMILVDQAKSLTFHAATLWSAGSDRALLFARMAKEAASEAACASARHAIQLHGGIAFTWESPVHVFAKRQKHNQMLYGNAAHQRRCLGEMLMGDTLRK